jgi:rhamnose utilization protein RhaD (predicted bifunctional aldolase and dehydrogenase)/NAD(P)-dependent dehydrogenase (short-subunit alcohol dehydrogenase family)
VRNRWDIAAPAASSTLADQCAYASRLLGAEVSLVLHGGGNSSIKQKDLDAYGQPIDALWVKGSGSDMATLTADGMTPLDLYAVRRMSEADEMSDLVMKNALRGAMLNGEAPGPSVESMVHAVVPDVAVLHTHADALLAISNTAKGVTSIESLYGDRVIIVPYIRSGFRAGRAVALAISELYTSDTIAIMLMDHGIFTFGATPRDAYDHMIDLVTEAERFVEENAHISSEVGSVSGVPPIAARDLAALRSAISEVAGQPFIAHRHSDPLSWAFSQDPKLESIAARGPITPDHVIWTRTVPMFGRDVTAYADAYRSYYGDHKHTATVTEMLDPAPRVVFDPEFGMVTVGPNVAAADAAGDIYLQTIPVICSAEALGGYESRLASDFFDVEYWELEQSKLSRALRPGEFSGEVAVVTGAASGIGKACASELLARGSAVIGLDINPAVPGTFSDAAFLGIGCDLADADATRSAVDAGVARFGGIDMLVAAAGLFPESAPIANHDPVAWRRAMSVNVDAFAALLSLVHPFLALAPRGGRVAVVGSKNVTAPGPGASAYSASKAAANQLTRVATLEWAADGIRVNSVHPDAVFDTALWTDELLAERAARYSMSVEDYKRRNLLSIEITSADVAGVVAATLGDTFSRVTGAHIPIDGGNDRVI